MREAGGCDGIRSGQQDRELIATKAAHHAARLQALPEARTDLAQEDVAHLMPEAVVDLFEVVDVEQQQGDALALPDQPLELLSQH